MVSLSRTSDASMAPVQASPIANGNVVQMDREAARLCALYATSAPGIQNNSGLSQSHTYIASL